jgi:hypothetical protein
MKINKDTQHNLTAFAYLIASVTVSLIEKADGLVSCITFILITILFLVFDHLLDIKNNNTN